MRNIKLRIEYDGTDFSGWQFQPGKRTVQGAIESALLKMTGEDVRIAGAGRTDQGVHAFGQVANVNIESSLRTDQIKNGINSLIDDDVHIVEAVETDPDFHARFSAKSKIYDYRINRIPSPIQRRYSWYVGYKLDIAVMEKAGEMLKGEHNFANFAVHNGSETDLCDLSGMSLTCSVSQIIITLKADRFLRKMARGIIGFMVDVGRGRFMAEDTLRVFGGEVHDLYFAPPQGLFLMEVIYR